MSSPTSAPRVGHRRPLGSLGGNTAPPAGGNAATKSVDGAEKAFPGRSSALPNSPSSSVAIADTLSAVIYEEKEPRVPVQAAPRSEWPEPKNRFSPVYKIKNVLGEGTNVIVVRASRRRTTAADFPAPPSSLSSSSSSTHSSADPESPSKKHKKNANNDDGTLPGGSSPPPNSPSSPSSSALVDKALRIFKKGGETYRLEAKVIQAMQNSSLFTAVDINESESLGWYGSSRYPVIECGVLPSDTFDALVQLKPTREEKRLMLAHIVCLVHR